MKPHFLLTLSAALLLPLLATAAPGQNFTLETGIYVFKTSDFRAIEAPGATTTSESRVVVLKGGFTIKFDQVTLALEGAHFSWSGNAGPPRQFSAIATPTVPLTAGRSVTLTYSAPAQYLERLADGNLQVREIPGDSPDGPHCALTFTARPADAAGEDLSLECALDLATVRGRERIPGVALEVGKPIVARFTDTVKFTAHPGDWSALFLKAPNGSDYSTLVLVKVVSAPASAPTLSKVADFHLKVGRFGAAAVAQGDYVYVIGGRNRSGILGDIERFDTRTQAIKVLTNKLTPRHHHGAALIGGKIYIFGGEGYGLPDSTPFEATTEIYDLESGKIAPGAPMPVPRSTFATATLGQSIYTIGGLYGQARFNGVTNRTEIYDPAADSWSDGDPMPTARDTRAAVAVNDMIIVVGGHHPPLVSTGTKTVECYLAGMNQWVRLPDLDQNVSANSAAVLGHYLFLFGNYDAPDDILAYDLTTHTSTIIKDLFTPGAQTTAVALNGMIYVIGGTGGGSRRRTNRDEMDDIQVFTLAPPASH